MPGVAVVLIWALSDHAFEWVGMPEPDWLWIAMLGLNIVGLVWMFSLIWVHPQRCITRALRDADDISHICTRCLYISDSVSLGEACPECGKTHPNRLVERWRTTAKSVSARRCVENALMQRPVTPRRPIASGAATDQPD